MLNKYKHINYNAHKIISFDIFDALIFRKFIKT
jgi:hypothetical protein